MFSRGVNCFLLEHIPLKKGLKQVLINLPLLEVRPPAFYIAFYLCKMCQV